MVCWTRDMAIATGRLCATWPARQLGDSTTLLDTAKGTSNLVTGCCNGLILNILRCHPEVSGMSFPVHGGTGRAV
jgi:hypothetical protein